MAAKASVWHEVFPATGSPVATGIGDAPVSVVAMRTMKKSIRQHRKEAKACSYQIRGHRNQTEIVTGGSRFHIFVRLVLQHCARRIPSAETAVGKGRRFTDQSKTRTNRWTH